MKTVTLRKVFALASVIFALTATSAQSGPISNLGAPALTSPAQLPAAIDVMVTAASTGCPAGFSLQWETQADYIAAGSIFGSSGDAGFCAASFSGVPGYNQGGGTRYSLDPNQSGVVRVGDLLLDQGASTSCTENLACNTSYVFRAFCHAVPKGLKKSDFSTVLIASTKPCKQDSACTLSQGYWKTHSKFGPASPKNYVDGVWDGTYISAYPVSGLYIGNNYYDEQGLYNILNTVGTRGNGLPALAHQLIAVKLDEARGTILSPEIATAVAQADALIGNLVPGVDSLPSSITSGLTTQLDNFIQANHCE